AVGNSLQPWLSEANLGAEDYELQGDAVSKRFEIQAIGALKLNSRGAGWREFHAVPPTGGPPTSINVGPDKNPKLAARELGCKKTVRKLLELYPDKRFFADKEKIAIGTSWKGVVQCSPAPAGTVPMIQFCDRHMGELNMGAGLVRRSIHALFGEQK
ncbi:unnamed protein product, partial [Prorocentrum cordatum]